MAKTGNGMLRAFARAFVDALKDGASEPSPTAESSGPVVVRIAYQELYETETPDNGPGRRYAYYNTYLEVRR